MVPKYESGTHNHSRTDAVVTKTETEASSPIIFLLDSKHESKSRTSSDSILNGSVSGSSKSSELSCSTFSSSSGYSSEDFILVNPKTASNSISSNLPASKFPPDAKPLCQEDYNNLKLNISISSTSQVSDTTDESLLSTVSITKYPSIQIMERQGTYDPNRVPSSIFRSNSSTPNEWSAASDESLFSINVSLSMDHEDPRKSEELPRWVELDRYEEISKSGELINFRQSAAVKEEHTEKSLDTKEGAIDGNNLIEAGGQHKPIKKEQYFEEEIKLGGKRDYSTAVGHSEGAYNAIHHSDGTDKSLAFPIDIKSAEPFCHALYYTRKKSRWPLCFYSYCSCRSCCFKWPSCWCECSGCLSCKWLSWCCCFHKWPSKQGCCCCCK
ncbi:hypothetical protein HAX54_050429 [Datura stramonium]|uniref:Uncharacterized protein n=1 Tax=Datura stramonium TaxID=4076 RepID=A0ABS8SX77_DATST|nr:hypothetical protein [Datura stramonium]